MLFSLYAPHQTPQGPTKYELQAQNQTEFQKKLFEIQSRLSEIEEQLNKIAQELEVIGKKLHEIGLALEALQEKLSHIPAQAGPGRSRNASDDRRMTPSSQNFPSSDSSFPDKDLWDLGNGEFMKKPTLGDGRSDNEDPFAHLTPLPPGYLASQSDLWLPPSPSDRSGSLLPKHGPSRGSDDGGDAMSRQFRSRHQTDRPSSPPPSVFPLSSFPPRDPSSRLIDPAVYAKQTSITVQKLWEDIITFPRNPLLISLKGTYGMLPNLTEGTYDLLDENGFKIGNIAIDSQERVTKININQDAAGTYIDHLKSLPKIR